MNFNQGWPRFIQRMIHTTSDGGIAVSAWGPVTAVMPSGAHVNVTTNYPFSDDAQVTLTGLQAPLLRGSGGVMTPVRLRIPSWATNASISINGAAPVYLGAAAAGTMYAVPLSGVPAGGGVTLLLAFNPTIRVSTWYNGAMSVQRGALVYALQLAEAFITLRTYHTNPTISDFNVTRGATSVPWNIVLLVDPNYPDVSFTTVRSGVVPAVPFSSMENPAIYLTAQARVVNTWGIAQDGSASQPPPSPLDCNTYGGGCGEVITVKLVPYGTTHLRMTQLPYTTLEARQPTGNI